MFITIPIIIHNYCSLSIFMFWNTVHYHVPKVYAIMLIDVRQTFYEQSLFIARTVQLVYSDVINWIPLCPYHIPAPLAL